MNHTPLQIQNNEMAQRIVNYLNENPCAIYSKLMEELNPSGLNVERIYQALFAGFIGLDPEKEEDRNLEEIYIWKGIHELSVTEFLNNDYYQHIQIPTTRQGDWNFQQDSYQPYEAFVCDDLLLLPDGTEIPQIGFFSSPFQYPVVYEKVREWMAIKPSEILSMKEPIQQVKGNVITFGLGLGYYTYMVSQKQNVESITVIEKEQNIIDLFQKQILPQFPHPEKVRIIRSDAFKYMGQMKDMDYDFAFVDLWHDALDGLPLYLEARKLAEETPQTTFLYWVENTLKSAERWNYQTA